MEVIHAKGELLSYCKDNTQPLSSRTIKTLFGLIAEYLKNMKVVPFTTSNQSGSMVSFEFSNNQGNSSIIKLGFVDCNLLFTLKPGYIQHKIGIMISMDDVIDSTINDFESGSSILEYVIIRCRFGTTKYSLDRLFNSKFSQFADVIKLIFKTTGGEIIAYVDDDSCDNRLTIELQGGSVFNGKT